MVETDTAQAPEPTVEKTSRLRNFRSNHPRVAKVGGIIAITGATLGALAVWKGRQQVVEPTEDHETLDEETSS